MAMRFKGSFVLLLFFIALVFFIHGVLTNMFGPFEDREAVETLNYLDFSFLIVGLFEALIFFTSINFVNKKIEQKNLSVKVFLVFSFLLCILVISLSFLCWYLLPILDFRLPRSLVYWFRYDNTPINFYLFLFSIISWFIFSLVSSLIFCWTYNSPKVQKVIFWFFVLVVLAVFSLGFIA